MVRLDKQTVTSFSLLLRKERNFSSSCQQQLILWTWCRLSHDHTQRKCLGQVSFSRDESGVGGSWGKGGGGARAANDAVLGPRQRDSCSHFHEVTVDPLSLFHLPFTKRSIVAQLCGYRCSSNWNDGTSVIVRLIHHRRSTEGGKVTQNGLNTLKIPIFSDIFRLCLAALLSKCCCGTIGALMCPHLAKNLGGIRSSGNNPMEEKPFAIPTRDFSEGTLILKDRIRLR